MRAEEHSLRRHETASRAARRLAMHCVLRTRDQKVLQRADRRLTRGHFLARQCARARVQNVVENQENRALKRKLSLKSFCEAITSK